jgi:GDP-4-dehydro-6-deoxy-D-mannose reductase
VTGASGFVGRHFCTQFGGVSFDDQEGAVNLCDANRVSSAALKPEAVLHLAAQSSVAASFQDRAATFAVNFTGTLNLLQALSAARFQGVFVYVGRPMSTDRPRGQTCRREKRNDCDLAVLMP